MTSSMTKIMVKRPSSEKTWKAWKMKETKKEVEKTNALKTSMIQSYKEDEIT